ncbi:MAG: hypothetical protein ACD_62C00275G0002 [uncultured bacterium]|nr:MAG: hypothetical protein ACD_62C00275G0002 [uncultured bacterium]
MCEYPGDFLQGNKGAVFHFIVKNGGDEFWFQSNDFRWVFPFYILKVLNAVVIDFETHGMPFKIFVWVLEIVKKNFETISRQGELTSIVRGGWRWPVT